MSNSAEVQATIKAAVDKWGQIDVVVNNAAMMTFLPVVDLPEADWDKVLAVNLKIGLPVLQVRHPAHARRARRSSTPARVHAHETEAGVAPYAASKGGDGSVLPACWRWSWRRKKIRVNCVAPGAVDTPMLWNNPNVKSGKEKVAGRGRQAGRPGRRHLLPRRPTKPASSTAPRWSSTAAELGHPL